jgi:hypothetical protein
MHALAAAHSQVELETRTLEEVDLALEILGSGAAPHVSR